MTNVLRRLRIFELGQGIGLPLLTREATWKHYRQLRKDTGADRIIFVFDSLQKIALEALPQDNNEPLPRLAEEQADDERLRFVMAIQQRTRRPNAPDGDPVLAISELRKPQYPGHRLKLADVRGSYQLVYSMDSVCLLEPRPEEGQSDDVCQVWLNIAKPNDAEEKGDIPLTFFHQIYRFAGGSAVLPGQASDETKPKVAFGPAGQAVRWQIGRGTPMTPHPLVLADMHCLEVFTLLGQPRRLFCAPQSWTDGDDVPWIATWGTSVVIGLTTLGPGWVWDEQILQDPERRQDYEERLETVLQAGPGRNHEALTEAVQELRLGGHAERLLWAIHRAVVAMRRSLLHLPDVYLAQAIWGSNRSAWPHDWHQVLGKVLKDLTWLHVADDSDDVPAFGSETVLLTHAGDLRASADDACPDDCPAHGSGRHHHFQIEVGPGFLGVLEPFAQVEEETGVRTYDFPARAKKGSKKLTLPKAGKTGRLVTVYLPAKLGEPAACKQLNERQHRLLQALVRETTRATRQPRQAITEAEVVSGNLVPNFQGRDLQSCRLLEPQGQYVGFNGNRRRRGAGYLLLSENGWLARAGYAPLMSRSSCPTWRV